MSNLSEEARKVRYIKIETLEKIKANNYKRLYAPYTRIDPEIVDRELRRKKKNKIMKAEKYKKIMDKRAREGVFH